VSRSGDPLNFWFVSFSRISFWVLVGVGIQPPVFGGGALLFLMKEGPYYYCIPTHHFPTFNIPFRF